MSDKPARGAVGRKDLLVAIDHGLLDGASDTASLLGFRRLDPKPTLEAKGGADEASTANQEVPPAQPFDELPPLGRMDPTPLWRAACLTYAPEPEVSDPGDEPKRSPPIARLSLADLGPDPEVSLPLVPPIAVWGQLRRVIEEVFRRPRPSGDIDVDQIVARIGRGQPVVRIPRMPRGERARRLIVVLDWAPRLVPFWRDQFLVAERIASELGAAGLSVMRWRDGPPSWAASDAELIGAIDPGLEAGDVVLVLGDLGHYGPPSVREHWARLGHALRRGGVQAAALLACPLSRWLPLVDAWRTIDWSHPLRPAPRGLAPESEHIEQQLDDRRDLLLDLLSWTVRLEPALLRCVRAALPASDADIGTEADLWNDARLGRHSGGLLVPPQLRREGQARLRAMMLAREREPLLRKIIDIVRSHHLAFAREIWWEEAQLLDSLDPQGAWLNEHERREVATFVHKLRSCLEGERSSSGGLGSGADLRSWAQRFTSGHVHEQVWIHGVLRADLIAVCKEAHRGVSGWTPPPGLSRDMLPPDPVRPPRGRWTIWQLDERLCVEPDGWAVARDERSSPLATVVARTRELWVGSTRHALDEARPALMDFPDEGQLSLATDCVEVVLRRELRPAWAVEAGRDRCGLWAAFCVGEVKQRMRWIPPGRFMMGSPETEEGRFGREGPQHEVTLTQGYWMAETPCTQALWEVVMGQNPSRFQFPLRPVENVSIGDVTRFIERLNEMRPGLDLELPTEAQWEYACRAGTQTATYAARDAVAWYTSNSGKSTQEVGMKLRNPWGLYDMLGNVYEWCVDWYAPYEAAAVVDPVVESGQRRVCRGGCWNGTARYVRAAYRRRFDPGYRNGRLGFRLVRGQEQEPAGKRSKGGEARAGDPPGSHPASA